MRDGMEVLRDSLSCGPRKVAAATAVVIPGCSAFRERERPGGALDNWAELCFDCVELLKNGV